MFRTCHVQHTHSLIMSVIGLRIFEGARVRVLYACDIYCIRLNVMRPLSALFFVRLGCIRRQLVRFSVLCVCVRSVCISAYVTISHSIVINRFQLSQ